MITPEAAHATQRRRIVVVGNGMASHRFCKGFAADPALRARYELVVAGEEDLPAYDRTRLSEGAVDRRPPPLLDDAAWYARAGIRLSLGVAVTAIDRQARAVSLADGHREPYDVLVLATGAEAALPPVEGADCEGVLVYRRHADVVAIREASIGLRRAAIVGGGLLGLEAARVLVDLGLQVCVIEHGRTLMSRQLDADSGALVDERVRAQGIDTRLGWRLRKIVRTPSGLRLTSDEHSTLEADLVVLATGIRPRDELAARAGLRIGARGGVIVDDHLRTDDPHVFAIGECAVHRGTHYGLVAPSYQMADVLLANLAGHARCFERGDTSCELKLLGIPVSAVGLSDREGTRVVHAGAAGRRTLVLDGRTLIGATAVGAWRELPRVRDAAERRTTLSQREIERFVAAGELWSGQAGIAAWPARTLICNCRGVTRGELSECVAAGLVDVAALTRRTGAGSVCGSCRPLLGELIGSPVAARTPGRRLVLGASLGTLLVAPLLMAVGPLPGAESVQAELHRVNELWRDPVSKQITGFTLLGLSLAGMLLSARKRLRWFSLGDFGAYRALHTIVSGSALALTAAHTGMRMGTNVNLALMITFLSVALVGAVTGVATTLEGGGSGRWALRARRLRPALTLAHVLLVWPLPLLLGLHLFSVYYF